MGRTQISPLQKQLGRVSRRLFVQIFLTRLAWCFSTAGVLVALWFLAQSLWLATLPQRLQLGIAGSIVGAGIALGIFLAILKNPSKLTAAFLLDQNFGLKERVTTSLLLPADQQGTPAGQALLADTNFHLAQLDVGVRFPVLPSRMAAVLPLAGLGLAVLTFYYRPSPIEARTELNKDQMAATTNALEIEKSLNQLKKQQSEPKIRKPASEDLQRMEAELDRIANQPHDTKEQLRDRIKEMTNLEGQMQDHQRELADKTQALKKQLQEMNRSSETKKNEEGPAKDLQKALTQGNLDKAREEMDRLAKKVKNNELTSQDKEQLAKQLKDLQQQLDRLSRQQDKEDRLKRLNREGKLDADTLQRELDKLKKDNKNLQDLQDLANKLGECQKYLKEGDSTKLAENLKEAAAKLKGMDDQQLDLQDLQEQLQRLQESKGICCKGLEGGDPNKPSPNGNNPVPGSGRRPLGEQKPFATIETKPPTNFDPKGQITLDGYSEGQTFKKTAASDLAGEVKHASQEAPEAIEHQRIPKSFRDAAKGYFRNLGGQDVNPPKK